MREQYRLVLTRKSGQQQENKDNGSQKNHGLSDLIFEDEEMKRINNHRI